MTDLLSQIEAAAALGEKATKRPWELDTDDAESSVKIIDGEGGIIGAVFGDDEFPCLEDDERPAVTEEAAATAKFIRAAANLPLSAIAEELRAKDAEIAKLLTILDDSGAGKMHRRCQKAESLLRRFVKYADSINRHGSDAFMALVTEAEALAAKESRQ